MAEGMWLPPRVWNSYTERIWKANGHTYLTTSLNTSGIQLLHWCTMAVKIATTTLSIPPVGLLIMQCHCKSCTYLRFEVIFVSSLIFSDHHRQPYDNVCLFLHHGGFTLRHPCLLNGPAHIFWRCHQLFETKVLKTQPVPQIIC